MGCLQLPWSLVGVVSFRCTVPTLGCSTGKALIRLDEFIGHWRFGWQRAGYGGAPHTRCALRNRRTPIPNPLLDAHQLAVFQVIHLPSPDSATCQTQASLRPYRERRGADFAKRSAYEAPRLSRCGLSQAQARHQMTLVSKMQPTRHSASSAATACAYLFPPKPCHALASRTAPDRRGS